MKHYFSFYHLKKLSIWYGAVFLLLAISFLAFYSAIHLLPESTSSVLDQHLNNLLSDHKLLIFIGVGFIAQMIDGSLGMAYGVSSTSFLMATGVSPQTSKRSSARCRNFHNWNIRTFTFQNGKY
jgi:preprotein translocase subunit SecY